MANIRVLQRLEGIVRETGKLRVYVATSGGVDKAHALAIDNRCSDILQDVARIASEARRVYGMQGAGALETEIRRALGYTHP